MSIYQFVVLNYLICKAFQLVYKLIVNTISILRSRTNLRKVLEVTNKDCTLPSIIIIKKK